MVENCSHEIKVIPVLWERPCNGVYKLNTDRSVLNNPDKIGGGGILRDHQGKLVYAFVVSLGIGTNYQA
uniref:Putative ovule protein n=1 Tax=Solanum chacoense TaxID=4108 RepID=A0A0V0HXN1_SOLCH